MKKREYCSVCAGKLRPSKRRPGWERCVDCGAWYEIEEPAKKKRKRSGLPVVEGHFCPKCGSMLFPSDKRPGARYCKKCEEYWAISTKAEA